MAMTSSRRWSDAIEARHRSDGGRLVERTDTGIASGAHERGRGLVHDPCALRVLAGVHGRRRGIGARHDTHSGPGCDVVRVLPVADAHARRLLPNVSQGAAERRQLHVCDRRGRAVAAAAVWLLHPPSPAKPSNRRCVYAPRKPNVVVSKRGHALWLGVSKKGRGSARLSCCPPLFRGDAGQRNNAVSMPQRTIDLLLLTSALTVL
jgi:hypothetical protein